MSNLIRVSLLFICAATGFATTDEWPQMITANYSDDCRPHYGTQYAEVVIDTVNLTYKQFYRPCLGAHAYWSRGTIELGETLQKTITAKKISYGDGSAPDWETVSPTLDGKFQREGNELVEYLADGKAWMRYRIK